MNKLLVSIVKQKDAQLARDAQKILQVGFARKFGRAILRNSPTRPSSPLQATLAPPLLSALLHELQPTSSSPRYSASDTSKEEVSVETRARCASRPPTRRR